MAVVGGGDDQGLELIIDTDMLIGDVNLGCSVLHLVKKHISHGFLK